MLKLKRTHNEIYVVGLPSYGGCFLPSARYFSSYETAINFATEERAAKNPVQMFTLFEYVEDKGDPKDANICPRVSEV